MIQVLAEFSKRNASNEFQPSMDIYTASAQPWDNINLDIPKFTKLPSPK
ncbi:hypothetical protein [Nostoc sp. WHI]|nr:hypothetical protein [Nostoc sp. WHI]